MPHVRLISLILLFVLSSLAGCSPTPPPAVDGLPPDFDLQFTVQGNLTSTDPFERSARYVLLPNRQFRALLGSSSQERTYPRLVRVVSPEEFVSVYQFIHQHSPEEGAVPNATPGPIRYQIVFVSYGKHYRLNTTPEESPLARELLGRLLELGRHSDYFDNEADPFPVAPPVASKR